MEERNSRKERVGKVVSNKMQKSISVAMDRKVKHPIYGKFMNKTTKFMAHDEKNQAEVGDKVAIVETRPVSARKRHTLDRVIEKPALREDTLAATKNEDEQQRPSSKSKADSEEAGNEEAAK